MPIARPKNIYVRTVSMGKRKSCPSCYHRLGDREQIWAVGEYIRGLWHTAMNFCPHCYQEAIVSELQAYSKQERRHCHIIMYRGETRPQWMHSIITATLASFELCSQAVKV